MVEAFDPRDPEFIQDPFPTFHRLRSIDPVHYSEPLGGWLVTSYDEVVAGLREARLSSDRVSPFIERLDPDMQREMCPFAASLKKWALFLDPPGHIPVRALLNRAFTAKAIEGLRRPIEVFVRDLLQPALHQGRMEFIGEFAYPLPARVICEMLGVPARDMASIMEWSAEIEPFLGLARKPASAYRAAKRGNDALTSYFSDLIEERRQHLGSDLLSGLIRAMDEQNGIVDEGELVATCNLLLFAAHRTTAHLLGNGLLALLRNPQQLSLLRADTSLLDAAVEELLRFDGPVQTVRRVALEAFDLGGRRIETGQLVFLMLNAANRDPAHFPEPDRLDIRRTGARHVGLGFGTHYCSGAPLARLEAKLFLAALLDDGCTVTLSSEDLRFIDNFGLRGLRALPIEIRRGS